MTMETHEDSEVELVERTIAFTDLVESTPLAEREGDLELLRQLRILKYLTRISTRSWGGEVVKDVGDGNMLAFEQAAPAVSAAIEIQRQGLKVGLPLRVGADHGLIAQVDGDYIGLVANVAARLTMLGAAGEVSLSGRVVRIAKLGGRCVPTRVRGLRRRVPVRTLVVRNAAN